MKNKRRISLGFVAIENYLDAKKEKDENNAIVYDGGSSVIDCITDILHWANHDNLDIGFIVRSAVNYFNEEK